MKYKITILELVVSDYDGVQDYRHVYEQTFGDLDVREIVSYLNEGPTTYEIVRDYGYGEWTVCAHCKGWGCSHCTKTTSETNAV